MKVPDVEVDHQEGADVLVLSWGGTYGPVHAGMRRVRANGGKVAHAHLRWLNPFPANLGDVLRSYDKVLIPEMNLGQLLQLVRARYLVDAVGYNRVTRQAVQGRRDRRRGGGDADVTSELKLTAKDFKSDQEVRWCPGCGDYAILAAVQSFMPELGIPKEKIVFVSGIGCAARFPYYMQTYGMHSIHGRAPAIATGLAVSRPDLSVWVISGDGDALSIGGNHLIHALRRNVNIKILMLNNQIYGLTKGQYSPTSEQGKVTGSTPMGSVDYPFNPLSVALGADATFVARALDTDKPGLTNVLRRAAAHEGTAFVEIFQNCNIYNDGAFDFVRDEKENRVYLEHGAAGRRHGHHARRDRLRDGVRTLARHVGRRTASCRSASSATCRATATTRWSQRRSSAQARTATCRRSSPPATPGRSNAGRNWACRSSLRDERLRRLALARDAHDLPRQAELLEPGDHPAARIHRGLELLHAVERGGRERVVVVVPALAERDQAQQPDVARLVGALEVPPAPEVADRVDRERHVVQQEDADRAAPEERGQRALPGADDQVAEGGRDEQRRPRARRRRACG